ncbi:MAG: Hpt domain-containing protein [Pseudomonadota bacterium]
MKRTGNPGTPVILPHTLNVAEGLERLIGDVALYRQLLQRFRNDHGQAVANLRQALEQGERAAAQRTLHGLRGAAGMIGAQALHELATGTEADFNDATMDLQPALALLDCALGTLLHAVDRYLDQAEDGAGGAIVTTTPAPAAETRLLLARLAQLLDDGNGQALDVLEQSAGVLAASLGVALYQEVAAAAHEFDFEAALQALRPAL